MRSQLAVSNNKKPQEKRKKRMTGNKSPNLIDAHVGNRIRMRRLMLGLSQEKLGEFIGITFQQVQKYEKGTNRIGAGRLYHLSQVLDVPVHFFFEDAPDLEHAKPAPGMEESVAPYEYSGFLSTSEGLELTRAFLKIKDDNVRKRIVDMVRAFAGAADSSE